MNEATQILGTYILLEGDRQYISKQTRWFQVVVEATKETGCCCIREWQPLCGEWLEKFSLWWEHSGWDSEALKRGNRNSQWTHEVIVTLFSNYGNANQGHTEMSFYTHLLGLELKSLTISSGWRGFGHRTFQHCWWEYELVQWLWKIVWHYILWAISSTCF